MSQPPDEPYSPDPLHVPPHPDSGDAPARPFSHEDGEGGGKPSFQLPWWVAIGIVGMTVVIGSIVSLLVVATVSLVAAAAGRGELVSDPSDLDAIMNSLQRSALGSAVLIVPQQLVFLAVALLLAWPLGRQWRSTYRLRKPRGRPWQWVAASFAPMALGMLASSLLEWLNGGPLELPQVFGEWFLQQQGWNVVAFLLLISLVPAVCEEMFFRGFLLGSLERRFSPWLAIGITGVVFGLAHLHPVHVVLVIPLGIWTALVARAFDSVYVAMSAHLVNNATSVLLVLGANDPESLADPVTAGTFAVSLAALAVAIPSALRGVRGRCEG